MVSHMSDSQLLSVNELCVYYETPTGDVKAVDGISFELKTGEMLGLVGESGCGKSTAAMGILQLVQPPGRIVSGQVKLKDQELLSLTESQMRHLRWTQLALIPQGAMNSLNPTMKICSQIQDVILTHRLTSIDKPNKKQVRNRIFELLKMVGLPERIYNMYPHELSGGMKQRVCIAMAIALNPSLIIADESTSALDVVVQRVVAQTILEVKQALGISMIMIGHDMGLMAQLVDRIAVMYAGKIVEIGTVLDIFNSPRHPYTQLLIESIPSLTERKPLKITDGITHNPRHPPPGCIFQLRCSKATDHCREVAPTQHSVSINHSVACHLYETTNAT